jgi:hypothetical protein
MLPNFVLVGVFFYFIIIEQRQWRHENGSEQISEPNRALSSKEDGREDGWLLLDKDSYVSVLAASACKWSNIINIDWRFWLLDRQLCISLTTVFNKRIKRNSGNNEKRTILFLEINILQDDQYA